MLKVNEIFRSLQGEGIRSGIPMTFIRLQGCSLGCTWCDTESSQGLEGGAEKTEIQVINEVIRSGQKWVCITGGEPLIQDLADLVRALRRHGFLIEVETSGTSDPPDWWRLVDWVVDVKGPSSGESGKFDPRWLGILNKYDQLKFVVSTEEDLDYSTGVIDGYGGPAQIVVSPVLPAEPGFIQKVVEFVQLPWETYQPVRFSYQLHKVIGVK